MNLIQPVEDRASASIVRHGLVLDRGDNTKIRCEALKETPQELQRLVDLADFVLNSFSAK
jgi:hypothetical protein